MMTNLKVRIGAKIEAARELAGLEQKELARLLDIPPTTLNTWETGNGYVQYEWIERIAAATGRSPVFFLPSAPTPDLVDRLAAAYPRLDADGLDQVLEFAQWLNDRHASSPERKRRPGAGSASGTSGSTSTPGGESSSS